MITLHKSIPYCVLLLPLAFSCSARASSGVEKEGSKGTNGSIGTITTTVIRPKFKATTLEGRVDEAMEKAKQDDLSYIADLEVSYVKNPEALLKHLEAYIDDSNEMVRYAVLDAASAFKTPRALKMLISLVEDEDIGFYSVRALYKNYNRAELLKVASSTLPGALIRNVIRNRDSIEGNLLLSFYKGNKEILDFLERRRKSYRPKKDGPNFIYQLASLDLALSELGKADAVERVNARFKDKKTEEVLAVFDLLKFVENKKVLLGVIELLKDKSNARRFEISHSALPPTYSRWCDEAFVALSRRTGYKYKPQYEWDKRRRFSDKELSDAYAYYKKWVLNVNTPLRKMTYNPIYRTENRLA